ITLRIYANEHDSKRFLILAKHEMIASVEIARESGDPISLALPLFELGKAHDYLHEHSEAVAAFSEAVKVFEKNSTNIQKKDSILADMKVHLAASEYMMGDKEALARAEQAL